MRSNLAKKVTAVGFTVLMASQLSLPAANASWGMQKLLNSSNNSQVSNSSPVTTTPTQTQPSNSNSTNYYNTNNYVNSRTLAYQRLMQSTQGTTTASNDSSSNTNTQKNTNTSPVVNNPVNNEGQVSSEISKDAQIMLDLVNGERVKNGLKPLVWHAKLGELAVLKSEDIIKNNYFSHTSPTYGSFYHMVYNAGVPFRQVGENLAMASNVQKAFVLLMASDGHRKNILSPHFTHLGIGVVPGNYGVAVTQLFIAQ